MYHYGAEGPNRTFRLKNPLITAPKNFGLLTEYVPYYLTWSAAVASVVSILFKCLVLVTTAQAADLTGIWLFSAETDDGLLRARLTLQATEPQLSARMKIDQHVLEGSGTVKGDEFDVQLQHAVSPGSSDHSDRVHLRGKLDGDQLKGTWDDGTNRGEWTGTRLE